IVARALVPVVDRPTGFGVGRRGLSGGAELFHESEHWLLEEQPNAVRARPGRHSRQLYRACQPRHSVVGSGAAARGALAIRPSAANQSARYTDILRPGQHPLATATLSGRD